eukprot:10588908-Heterocapsa_arctica.AAC.1
MSSGYGYGGATLGKGVAADKEIVRDAVTWLGEAGLRGLLRMRSDGEPAVVQVLKAIANARGKDGDGMPLTILEESPNKSSASL